MATALYVLKIKYFGFLKIFTNYPRVQITFYFVVVVVGGVVLVVVVLVVRIDVSQIKVF
jgi:hypothetical protein